MLVEKKENPIYTQNSSDFFPSTVKMDNEDGLPAAGLGTSEARFGIAETGSGDPMAGSCQGIPLSPMGRGPLAGF